MHTRTSKHSNKNSGVRLNPQPQVPRPAQPGFLSGDRPSRTKGSPPRTQNSPDAALAALAFSFFFLAALALVLRPIVIGDAVRSSGRVARGYRYSSPPPLIECDELVQIALAWLAKDADPA